MGYRHTSCIKPWAPREEGESGEDALALVSETIGTRPIYVRRLLDTLTVVEWAEANAFWGNEALPKTSTRVFLSSILPWRMIKSGNMLVLETLPMGVRKSSGPKRQADFSIGYSETGK